MSTICSLRIPTQDLGRGQYNTIPLAGKTSYKVANHSNNRSSCFSILAYTWDSYTNSAIRNAATRELIELALTGLGHVKISSATGEGYVNIKPFVAKEGNSLTRKIGFMNNGWMSGLMGSIGAVQSWNKLWEKPEDNPKEVLFGITAHRTADTKLTFNKEITLNELSLRLEAEKAWGSGTTLLEMAQTSCEKTSALNELKKMFWG